MKAVIWTDVFQSLLMFGSMVAIVIAGTLRVGGLANVMNAAKEGGRLALWGWAINLTNLSIHHHRSSNINEEKSLSRCIYMNVVVTEQFQCQSWRPSHLLVARNRWVLSLRISLWRQPDSGTTTDDCSKTSNSTTVSFFRLYLCVFDQLQLICASIHCRLKWSIDKIFVDWSWYLMCFQSSFH